MAKRHAMGKDSSQSKVKSTMKFGTKAHFAALRLVPRIPEFSEATFQDEAEAEVAEIIQKMRFEFAAA